MISRYFLAVQLESGNKANISAQKLIRPFEAAGGGGSQTVAALCREEEPLTKAMTKPRGPWP